MGWKIERAASDASGTPRRDATRSVAGPLIEGMEARVLFAAGTLDPTFNAGDEPGKARVVIREAPTLDELHSVTLLPDGKILLSGITGTRLTGSHFALARLNADGTLDNGFAGGGTTFFDFG